MHIWQGGLAPLWQKGFLTALSLAMPTPTEIPIITNDAMSPSVSNTVRQLGWFAICMCLWNEGVPALFSWQQLQRVYPFVARTIHSASVEARAALALFKHLGFRQSCVLHQADTAGLGYADVSPPGRTVPLQPAFASCSRASVLGMREMPHHAMLCRERCIRGHGKVGDTTEQGREVIPSVRDLVIEAGSTA